MRGQEREGRRKRRREGKRREGCYFRSLSIAPLSFWEQTAHLKSFSWKE